MSSVDRSRELRACVCVIGFTIACYTNYGHLKFVDALLGKHRSFNTNTHNGTFHLQARKSLRFVPSKLLLNDKAIIA